MESKIKINDYVIVRGNCDVNREVGKSREVYLTIGYRDKEEEGADFTCIREARPMNRFFKRRFNGHTLQDDHNIIISFNAIRIISNKTGKVYDVNEEWCVGYAPNSQEYKEAVAFEALDYAINEALYALANTEI